jgi:hypothetical protein
LMAQDRVVVSHIHPTDRAPQHDGLAFAGERGGASALDEQVSVGERVDNQGDTFVDITRSVTYCR